MSACNKIFLSLCMILSCAGCMPLVKNWDIRMQEPISSNALNYGDEFIEISFAIAEDEIAFNLKNKTDVVLKLDYNGIFFFSPDGASLPVQSTSFVMSKTFSIKRKPIMIKPSSSTKGVIIPVDNIFRHYSWGSGSYVVEFLPLFPNYPTTYVGKEFGIYLPLWIQDMKKEYFFKFRINSLQRKKSQKEKDMSNMTNSLLEMR